MKKKIFGVIALVLLLSLAFPTVVLAGDGEDGMDVDIDITTGGDAEVDVDIDAGGDVDLTINGEIPRFGAGTGSAMTVRRIAIDTVAPYLQELYEKTGVVSDALAKLIKVVGNDHTHELAAHDSQIYNLSVENQSIRSSIEDVDNKVDTNTIWLEGRIEDEASKTNNRINQLTLEYNKILTWVILGASAAIAILLALVITLFVRVRRNSS